MGIGDLYQPPPPDPNAPVIPWGSPQAAQLVKQQNANYDPVGLNAFTQVGDKLDANAVARANALHFSGGQPGAPPGAQGQGQPAAPLLLPGAGAGGQVIKAHDVQLASDVGIEAKKRAADEAKSAFDQMGRAKYEENEANAQAAAGYQGQLRGGQMDQEKADADTRAKVAGAYDDWKKAQDVDPEHYQSHMSKAKRVMMTIAAGLSGFGMALRGQSGKNPILEQIENETRDDMEAQKSKRDKALSLYTHARENGLDEEKAHALVYTHNAELAKAGLDAAVIGNASPTRLAEAEQHKAAIDDSMADYWNKAEGRAQPTMAGGSKGWTDAMAKESQELLKTDHEKGGNMTVEQAMVNVARSHNLPYAGGPSLNNDRIAGAGGAGRQAGVQMEHQRMLGRYDSALDQIDKAIGHLKGGYKFGDEQSAENLKTTIAQEYAFLMHGGSSEGAVKEIKDSLPDLNQSSFGQWARGGAGTKTLEQIKQQLTIKRAQEEAAGKAIPAGTGFGAPTKEADTAADLGAVER